MHNVYYKPSTQNTLKTIRKIKSNDIDCTAAMTNPEQLCKWQNDRLMKINIRLNTHVSE